MDQLEDNPPPEWLWNLMVVMTYVPVALICVLWWLHRGDWVEVHLQIFGYQPVRDLVVGTGVGLIVTAGSRWVGSRFPWAQRLEEGLMRLMGPLSLTTCAVLAAASSVGEEFLFRGVIQPEIGLFWASLLFAIVHVPMEKELVLWPVFAFAMGLVLGGFYHWSGALTGPIAIHFTINFLNLRWLAARAASNNVRAH